MTRIPCRNNRITNALQMFWLCSVANNYEEAFFTDLLTLARFHQGLSSLFYLSNDSSCPRSRHWCCVSDWTHDSHLHSTLSVRPLYRYLYGMATSAAKFSKSDSSIFPRCIKYYYFFLRPTGIYCGLFFAPPVAVSLTGKNSHSKFTHSDSANFRSLCSLLVISPIFSIPAICSYSCPSFLFS